jgi:hypothetical protein
MKGAMPMKNETNKSTTTGNTFSKKIGRTKYNVQIFFSKTSKENFNDKLLRLIKNDVANGTKQT